MVWVLSGFFFLHPLSMDLVSCSLGLSVLYTFRNCLHNSPLPPHFDLTGANVGREPIPDHLACFASTAAARPGACTHCKKLKVRVAQTAPPSLWKCKMGLTFWPDTSKFGVQVKCDFPPGENTCNKCNRDGEVCVVEGRKPRTPKYVCL